MTEARDKNSHARFKHDLRDADYVRSVIGTFSPKYVFLAAAHAGGIKEAIEKPVEMLSDNLLIQTNLINACHEYGVKKLINLGSSCLYPVDGKQPYKEEQLGTGKTDENWSYAVAKLAGVELCRAYHRQYGDNFMTVMPCNLYGINDKFGENAHVIPSLIEKCHKNDEVIMWGKPETRREFLFSDDLAKACVMLMEDHNYDDLFDGVINVGSGIETTIQKLCLKITQVVQKEVIFYFKGKEPCGVPSKLMDSSRMRALGWEPTTSLEDGLKEVYRWYIETCSCDKSGSRKAAV